ncbi:MAG: cation-translocating P-type ATPase [Candidatus Algichlamydia australiensis]|nr:cation-translocating P-type ATPase [Chlamydiales bacterium]
MSKTSPFLFDEYFASGKAESISPFLKPRSRKVAKNLDLKSSLASAFFLALSFILSFFQRDLSAISLCIVYFLAGTPALIHTIKDLRSLEINIDVLMTLAALLSFFIGSQMEGALLLVLFSLSHSMEHAVSAKAKGALHKLNELTPHFATVISDDGTHFEKAVREISPGEKILIKAGETVPLDGKVLSGSSFLNLVHLTGESLPIPKKSEDMVQAGSKNLDGSLTVEVAKSSSESTLSRIVKLMEEAQESKPRLQRFFDRFGRVYATSIIGISAFFAFILPLFGLAFLGPEGALYRALAFLIAASPCALIIATPTAYLASMSACARRGILLKGGVTLDALSECKRIAFDKTGTLTTGKLKLIQITPHSPDALSIAAALESHAHHPIADAIITKAKEENLALPKLTQFESKAGYGLMGEVEGKRVAIGHAAFIESLLGKSPEFESQGKMVTLLLLGNQIYTFHFEDELRESTATALQNLSKYELYMFTGDHEESAKNIAHLTGIQNYKANLRPDDKLRLIAEISDQSPLAMVGDGINDAPALARAHVGISLGTIGSDTAIEASDIVILNDDLSSLSWLTKKAKKTMSIVRQNLVLALGVIALATTPALLGLVPLWMAVLLHEGGTIIVGLNSLRLLKRS